MIDRDRAEREKKILDLIDDDELKTELIKLFSESWQDGYDFANKEITLNRGASF